MPRHGICDFEMMATIGHRKNKMKRYKPVCKTRPQAFYYACMYVHDRGIDTLKEENKMESKGERAAALHLLAVGVCTKGWVGSIGEVTRDRRCTGAGLVGFEFVIGVTAEVKISEELEKAEPHCLSE